MLTYYPIVTILVAAPEPDAPDARDVVATVCGVPGWRVTELFVLICGECVARGVDPSDLTYNVSDSAIAGALPDLEQVASTVAAHVAATYYRRAA